MNRQSVLALGLWLVPALAAANPIATEIVRARQVPGSRHVQLTYATDQSLGAAPDPQMPLKATRDDVELSLSWQLLAGSFTANTGSGLASTRAIQACDCSVAVGKHDYVVRVRSAGQAGKETDLALTIDVMSDLHARPDAGVGGADMMPWEIPEPGEIQGLDCAAVCDATSTDGPGARLDAGPGAGPDAATNPPPHDNDDDSGCSFGPGRALVGPLLAVGFMLLALVLLRRR